MVYVTGLGCATLRAWVRIADVRTVPCCAGTVSRLLTESTVETFTANLSYKFMRCKRIAFPESRKYDGPSVLLAMPVERRI